MKPETRLQIDLVTWIKKVYPNALFTSTQAGDRRNTLAAMMMKRQGYRNGTPDLIFFEPRNSSHGLLLELKTEKGVTSEAQDEFQNLASRRGYFYAVAYGIDQAKETITEYLGG